MKSQRWGRPPWAAVVLLGALAWAPPAPAGTVVPLTQIGTPNWAPVDFNLFTAPSEPLAAALATAQSILPLPYHLFTPNGIIIPGAPHAGPYDHEIGNGLAALGIPNQSVFQGRDFAGMPNGVWLAYNLVPHPGTVGSSPDFASGPIIPESVFPIVDTVDVLRNGADFDLTIIRSRPLSQLPVNPPFNVDGSSHRPQLLFEDLPSANNPLGLTPDEIQGHYELLGHLRDAQGNGYDFRVEFDVVPEPASLALFGVGGLSLFGYQWRRRYRRLLELAAG